MLPHNIDLRLDGGLHSLELEFLRPFAALRRPDCNLDLLSDFGVHVIWQRHRLIRVKPFIQHDYNLICGRVHIEDPHMVLKLGLVPHHELGPNSEYSSVVLELTLQNKGLAISRFPHVVIGHRVIFVQI